MKPTLCAGLTDSVRYAVDPPRTIDFMGDAARVYATPMLVRDVENACRNLLQPHLDAGEDTVGTRIELDHLAATPLGFAVTLKVRIGAVNGRAVGFEFEGHDGVDTICRGNHQRFVADVKKTEARIAAKKQKVAAA